MEGNLFQRVAKALIRNGIIAGKAETLPPSSFVQVKTTIEISNHTQQDNDTRG